MSRKQVALVKYATKEEALVTRERKQVVLDRVFDGLLKAHGHVSVALVLEAARSPKSPIHRHFEWDDAAGAEKWRQHQALQMIQASRFVAYLTRDEKAPPPAVTHGTEVRRLVSAFRGDGNFVMRNEAMQDADMRAVIVQRKRAELRGWCRSVIDVEELREIRESIIALVGSD